MGKFFAKLKRSWLKRFGSDRQIVEQLYKSEHGHLPDLLQPRTFNEKIQWYKLHYRNPLMTLAADKHRVREYVAQLGLGHLLNELHGVYDSAAQIDFDALPAAFVLKANHGSGMNIICKDKAALDRDDCRQQMERWLKTDFYRPGREWAYKNIRPRIVCEKYLENEDCGELIDYKFYCYGGKPEVVFVCCNRFGPGGVRHECYDLAWKQIHVLKGRPAASGNHPRPSQFAEMIAAAATLAAGFPYVRVDLYLVQGRIIFGEMTFYPDSGLLPFSPPEFNRFFGDLFVLPEKSA